MCDVCDMWCSVRCDNVKWFVHEQVGRPNNVPQAAPIIAAIQEEAAKIPRIYVASIHLDLSSQDVKRWTTHYIHLNVLLIKLILV